MRVHTVYPHKVTWGGWHTRYPWGLLIRIDNKYPQDVRKLVRYHEIREDHYMRDWKLPYKVAHWLANQDEKVKFGVDAFNREMAYTRAILRKNRT